ncbi:MAG: sel1 repeat family protein [Campylobacteraceae bacterium]|jgi:TPR repeat protein|nr:sel1 repeat family protein [Campylobacteraceae bacterium]
MRKIVFVLIGILTTAIYATDVDEAFEALKNGDDAKAVKLYKKACESENMSGCTGLGVMYWYGSGVKKDIHKAVEIFKKSCGGKDAEGCNNLGFMYEQGEDVEEDINRALEYYAKACELKLEVSCKNYRDLKSETE